MMKTSNIDVFLQCSIVKNKFDLSAFKSYNYSLWKVTKKTYQQTTHSAAIKMRNGQWSMGPK